MSVDKRFAVTETLLETFFLISKPAKTEVEVSSWKGHKGHREGGDRQKDERMLGTAPDGEGCERRWSTIIACVVKLRILSFV